MNEVLLANHCNEMYSGPACDKDHILVVVSNRKEIQLQVQTSIESNLALITFLKKSEGLNCIELEQLN